MKKSGCFFLSFMMFIMILATYVSTPVSAATTEVKLENYNSHPQFEQLSKAYIEYSLQAEKMGKFVTLPLECFITEYQPNKTALTKSSTDYNSIDTYLASRVSELSQNENLIDVRTEQVEMQKTLDKELSLENTISPQSSGGYWFYNCSELPKAGNYTKYPSLLGSAVVTGDLVHDDQGSFGITGHSAIVMGHYYSNVFKEYYVRVCEAVSAGVCYGILSDDRVVNRTTSVYRITATSTQRVDASNWVASQRGKSWWFTNDNFYNINVTKSRTNWYCSLLVYAAYAAQGVNLGDMGGTGAIMPRELRNSTRASRTF